MAILRVGFHLALFFFSGARQKQNGRTKQEIPSSICVIIGSPQPKPGVLEGVTEKRNENILSPCALIGSCGRVQQWEILLITWRKKKNSSYNLWQVKSCFLSLQGNFNQIQSSCFFSFFFPLRPLDLVSTLRPDWSSQEISRQALPMGDNS